MSNNDREGEYRTGLVPRVIGLQAECLRGAVPIELSKHVERHAQYRHTEERSRGRPLFVVIEGHHELRRIVVAGAVRGYGLMNWLLSGLAWPQISSTAGLALDIVGVVILIQTGLPSKAIRNTGVYEAFDERMAAKYDRWARWGAAAIVAGFVLQIAGIWLQRI